MTQQVNFAQAFVEWHRDVAMRGHDFHIWLPDKLAREPGGVTAEEFYQALRKLVEEKYRIGLPND